MTTRLMDAERQLAAIKASTVDPFTAAMIYEAAFFPGRGPRSDAYKLGVLTTLRVRVDGESFEGNGCPFMPGSAEFDAFFAGREEGRAMSPVSGVVA